MGRPKKEVPNHGNLYEVKITTGKTFDGALIRKSFYSATSKDDAKRQSNEWKINKEVTERAGDVFVDKDITFTDWIKIWLETYKKGKVKEHTYDYTYRVNYDYHYVKHWSAQRTAGAKMDRH